MDMKELSSIMQQNGIVGAGGAGFPTYAKLNENADTIILNCAECEPLLRLHRQLLEKYAQEIVDTFHLMILKDHVQYSLIRLMDQNQKCPCQRNHDSQNARTHL